MQNQNTRLIRRGKPVVAALLALLVLLLDAMAASPELHELIHQDAHEAGHTCAVTLFAHGQVELADCTPPTPSPAAWFETVLFPEFLSHDSVLETLPRGRAPPSPLSLQQV